MQECSARALFWHCMRTAYGMQASLRKPRLKRASTTSTIVPPAPSPPAPVRVSPTPQPWAQAASGTAEDFAAVLTALGTAEEETGGGGSGGGGGSIRGSPSPVAVAGRSRPIMAADVVAMLVREAPLPLHVVGMPLNDGGGGGGADARAGAGGKAAASPPRPLPHGLSHFEHVLRSSLSGVLSASGGCAPRLWEVGTDGEPSAVELEVLRAAEHARRDKEAERRRQAVSRARMRQKSAVTIQAAQRGRLERQAVVARRTFVLDDNVAHSTFVDPQR